MTAGDLLAHGHGGGFGLLSPERIVTWIVHAAVWRVVGRLVDRVPLGVAALGLVVLVVVAFLLAHGRRSRVRV